MPISTKPLAEPTRNMAAHRESSKRTWPGMGVRIVRDRYGDPTVEQAADEMAEEGQTEHPLHPQRIADRGADEHRDRHPQKGLARDLAAARLVEVEGRAQGGHDIAPRHERESRGNQGDTTGHEQTTRIHAVGLRSEAVHHRARGIGKCRELFLDNRVAETLPGVSRFDASRSAG